MTTSTHDGEALNAMRMANKMVTDAGTTWQDVLGQGGVREMHITLRPGQAWSSRAQQAPQEDWGAPAPHLKDKVIIDMMFRGIFAQPRVGHEEFWQTMDSIHGHFQKFGALTAGQYRAVQNSYRRAMMSRKA